MKTLQELSSKGTTMASFQSMGFANEEASSEYSRKVRAEEVARTASTHAPAQVQQESTEEISSSPTEACATRHGVGKKPSPMEVLGLLLMTPGGRFSYERKGTMVEINAVIPEELLTLLGLKLPEQKVTTEESQQTPDEAPVQEPVTEAPRKPTKAQIAAAERQRQEELKKEIEAERKLNENIDSSIKASIPELFSDSTEGIETYLRLIIGKPKHASSLKATISSSLGIPMISDEKLKERIDYILSL